MLLFSSRESEFQDYVNLLGHTWWSKVLSVFTCCGTEKYVNIGRQIVDSQSGLFKAPISALSWVASASSPLSWGPVEHGNVFSGFGSVEPLKHSFVIVTYGRLIAIKTELGLFPFPTIVRPGGCGQLLNLVQHDEGTCSFYSTLGEGTPYELRPAVELVACGGLYVVSWLVDANTRLIKFDRDQSHWLIKVSTFETVRAAYVETKGSMNPSFVSSQLLTEGTPEWRREAAARLVAYFGGVRYGEALTYFSANVSLAGKLLENHGKPYATAIAPNPTTNPAVLPDINPSMDVLAVTERVFKPNPIANHKKFDIDLVEPFVDEFIKQMRRYCDDTVVPISPQEVIESQKTKATREKNLRAMGTLPVYGQQATIKAFLKKESYPKQNAPRNISDMDAGHNFLGFQYLIPLKSRVFKSMPFYCPGLQPLDVADRVKAYVERTRIAGKTVLEGDYTRYDGSQTERFRRIAFRIARAFVKPDAHRDWDKLVDSHFAATAKTAIEKHSYDLFGSMYSGSFFTTDGNTLGSAFVSFVALHVFGELPAEMAFDCLGLAFGDDTITCGEKQWHVAAAEACGLTLKMLETVHHVSFLSRNYPMICGTRHSAPSVRRTLDKIHIVCRVLPENEQAVILHQKLSSILLLGPNTPLLSNYCRAVLRISGLTPLTAKDVQYDQYWLSDCTDEVPFEPLNSTEWTYIALLVAEEFGITVGALKDYCSAMDRATELEQLRNLIHSQPAVFNSDYFFLGSLQSPPPFVVESLQPSRVNPVVRSGKKDKNKSVVSEGKKRDAPLSLLDSAVEPTVEVPRDSSNQSPPQVAQACNPPTSGGPPITDAPVIVERNRPSANPNNPPGKRVVSNHGSRKQKQSNKGHHNKGDQRGCPPAKQQDKTEPQPSPTTR